jgi:uncharacterized protein (UPF0332 family)
VTDVARTLAQHRLARARESLRDGEVLLESGSSVGAVNRFYYAAFHAARAVLSLRQLDSSRHAGVIALFQRHFVKTGLIPTDVARALPRAFEKRLDSDYEDFAEVSGEDARRVGAETHRFVEACEALLSNDLPQASGPD